MSKKILLENSKLKYSGDCSPVGLTKTYQPRKVSINSFFKRVKNELMKIA